MKPRILLIGDVSGWAFERNLRDLAEHLAGEFDAEFWFVYESRPPPMDGYAAIYAAHRWKLDGIVPYDRAVGSLRAAYMNPYRPGDPTAEDIAAVNQWGAFHTVTRSACDALRPHCPRVRYLTNPVNVVTFGARTPVRGRVVASWSGNARHPHASGLRVKGFEEVIVPACRAAVVPLVYAESRTRPVAPADMPEFYQRGNVTLCASLFEGASNSVMEAMACGHAVLATDVGNHAEMRASQMEHFGDSGIALVERAPEAFADALASLTPARAAEMGEINREEIHARWSWGAWRDRYRDIIQSVARAS